MSKNAVKTAVNVFQAFRSIIVQFSFYPICFSVSCGESAMRVFMLDDIIFPIFTVLKCVIVIYMLGFLCG